MKPLVQVSKVQNVLASVLVGMRGRFYLEKRLLGDESPGTDARDKTCVDEVVL